MLRERARQELYFRQEAEARLSEVVGETSGTEQLGGSCEAVSVWGIRG